jgi:hypothetical protein
VSPARGACQRKLERDPLFLLSTAERIANQGDESNMSNPSVGEQLGQMITGYWVSRSIYVAAKLKIPDRLLGGPKTADELAAATGMHTRSLYRLLRALASRGVFFEDTAGRFSLTPLSEGLLSQRADSQWALAVLMGEERYHAWGDLLESIRTGQTAFERLYGKPLFDYLGDHPEQSETFDAAMTGVHGRETRAMIDAFDFSGIRALADIGGGNGSTLMGVLGEHSQMRGILFDVPGVAERARAQISRAGLANRCDVIGGSFFEAIPEGADAYMLRHVIHDWDDDRATAILRNVRAAMGAAARLLVVESVINPGNEPAFAKLLDLNMLVVPGGAERTRDEYRRLYEAAGLRLTRIVPTDAEVCVIEGEAA